MFEQDQKAHVKLLEYQDKFAAACEALKETQSVLETFRAHASDKMHKVGRISVPALGGSVIHAS